MAKPEKNSVSTEEPVRLKKRSYWGEVWHQLKKNPVSVICLVFLTLLIIATVFSTWITPYDYAKQDLMLRFAKPSSQHIMGCDGYGRDLFSRLLVGGRYSLMVAVISVAIGIVLGMVIGALCGFFGKAVDNTLMRVMDVIMAIPGMMLAICISVSLGSGVWQTALAIAAGTIPIIARQLRGSTLLIHDQEYIEAARTFGESNARIIIRHVIPNCLAPIIVQSTLYLGGSIMAIAGLSFIGLGVLEPTPEWGSILNIGLDNVSMLADRWHTIVFPALFIILTMLAFNLLGDGLRDAMDPRMRK